MVQDHLCSTAFTLMSQQSGPLEVRTPDLMDAQSKVNGTMMNSKVVSEQITSPLEQFPVNRQHQN